MNNLASIVKTIEMKNLLMSIILVFILASCGGDSDDIDQIENVVASEPKFEWTIPESLINGSNNPFPLAKDPNLLEVKDVDFLFDVALVAAVKIDGQVKIYPYNFLNTFESVNDNINDKSYALTYCPLTKSALLINRVHKNEEFVLRASGYLLHDNVILKDENSDTYWSQMLGQCIKGSYAGDFNNTFNFVEMTWKTVKENFPDAQVFTMASVESSTVSAAQKKTDIKIGDLVYGIIGTSRYQQALGSNDSKSTEVFIYHYDDFGTETTLKTITIDGSKTLVIGNKEDHYITSYINDSNVEFEAVQNRFPIVMKDSDNNEWDVFGVAMNGPRKGEQLESHTAFFALFWAWENFYNNFYFDQ